MDHKTEVKEAADGANKQILGGLATTQDSVDGVLERFRRAAGIRIPDLSAMDRTDLEHATVTLIQDLTRVQANFQSVRLATNKNLAKIIRAGNSSPTEEDIRKVKRAEIERGNARPPMPFKAPPEASLKKKIPMPPKMLKKIKPEPVAESTSVSRTFLNQFSIATD